MFSYFTSKISDFGSKFISKSTTSESSTSHDLNENNLINDVFSKDFVEEDIEISGDENAEEEIDEDSDDWNDEFEAFEDSAEDKRFSHLNVCKESINGVVTAVDKELKEIVVDDTKRIKIFRCTFGDIEVGDLVRVESNKKESIVKPLRYKILTGRITDDENWKKRFIFGRHAFMRKSPETEGLKVNDVIKVIVIEVRNNNYNWRAIKYTPERDPEADNEDVIQSFTNDLLENKNDIIICDKIDFKEMKLNSKKSLLVWIRNKGSEPQTLESCDVEEGENQVSFKSFQQFYGKCIEKPFIIPPQKECYVELICDAKYCGDHNELLMFKFNGFTIGRFTSVTVLEFNSVNDKYIHGNRFDCTSARRRMFGNDTWIIPGEKVWNPNKHIQDRLLRYAVPEVVWRALENNWTIEEHLDGLKEPLSKENYQKKFHALIYLEECENHFNIRGYDMENVELRRDGKYFTITVPGLADGRPSLIVSDKVLCYDGNNANQEQRIVYEGFIHQIRLNEILMRFNEKFHNDFRGGAFKVSFQMSRMLYRRCHHAIDLAPHMVDQVLFPNKVLIKKPFKQIPMNSIKWFNQSLNIQQKLAVVGVLRGECRPTPYIIFGPPGTGKTVTIVESILQVFDKIPQSRIIACTAANSSADLIAAKLLESGRVSPQDLIRITAFHRIHSIPELVRSVTQIVDEDEKKWLYHRIIVTTSCQSGVIFRHKISPSHFTHVFIDEAAQVMEPESLIPISMSVIGHGCVVLAGDHQQLGPVCMSQKAKHYRLNHSLLERLMTGSPPYERNEQFAKYGFYNPRFVTKLINNYRSDPQIMVVSSEIFYENELICINKSDEELIKSMGLKKPFLFNGVRGDDRQDPDCPSWYNPQEIIQSCSYLEQLYKVGVKPKDIGIITPYRKQVIRMRQHMRDLDLKECKVATIEEFQGDEKRVIIVSMVRANQVYLDHDQKFNLGFIHNAKRFNVAISRAMALLICIGDPHLLGRDKCWAKFIEYCLQNDTYTGCQFKNFKPISFRKKTQFKG